MMKKDAPRGTRTGFTTGACSAAAARAATVGLVTGEVPAQIECLLPNGDLVTFAVLDGAVNGNTAHAMVIKDAGDDPDCTDKAHLTADVTLRRDLPREVLLTGGFGVGTVTMPGLGLAVGGPAINPVPRRNITANVQAAAGDLLEESGFEVCISVPQGEEMTKKNAECATGHFGRHFDPWHHRHRQAVFNSGVPRQRGAGCAGGRHAGSRHRGADDWRANRKVRHD